MLNRILEANGITDYLLDPCTACGMRYPEIEIKEDASALCTNGWSPRARDDSIEDGFSQRNDPLRIGTSQSMQYKGANVLEHAAADLLLTQLLKQRPSKIGSDSKETE